jgi:hypothetical protein
MAMREAPKDAVGEDCQCNDGPLRARSKTTKQKQGRTQSIPRRRKSGCVCNIRPNRKGRYNMHPRRRVDADRKQLHRQISRAPAQTIRQSRAHQSSRSRWVARPLRLFSEPQSTELVQIAERLFDFSASESGETFGVPRSGPKVVQMLRGGKTSLRNQLSRQYFEKTSRAATQQAIADALLVVEGKAQQVGPKSLHLRVARHESAIWIDIGDATGRAIRVDSSGWRVEPDAPVLFKRTALTGALPEPRRGGALDQLWVWLNVAEEDRVLVAAWLVAALSADIPHPILSLAGEQGSGKSTAEKVLVSLMDLITGPAEKASARCRKLGNGSFRFLACRDRQLVERAGLAVGRDVSCRHRRR